MKSQFNMPQNTVRCPENLSSKRYRHYNRAAVINSYTQFLTGPWTEAWQNTEGRWQITKVAYTIYKIQRTNRRKWQRMLPHIPTYVYDEMSNQLKRLTSLPRCDVSQLPKEFCSFSLRII